jgi:hypothetical protein
MSDGKSSKARSGANPYGRMVKPKKRHLGRLGRKATFTLADGAKVLSWHVICGFGRVKIVLVK